MYMTKTHSKEMDSHSYRNVYDENPYTIIWIVICTNMEMTKTHKKMDRHVHVCTNDYPYYCVWVFVIHISVQMTIYALLLNGFSSCTCLYE